MQFKSTVVVCAMAAWLHGTFVIAAPPLETISLSGDTWFSLQGVVVSDDGVAVDDLAGGITSLALPGVPQAADLDGFARLSNGDLLVSFDTAVELPGADESVIAKPHDVMRLSSGVYTLEFDGSAAGVPDGINVDAVGFLSTVGLLLSFDTAVDLDGTTAADEDVVVYDGLALSVYWDASAAGVSGTMDLDGVHALLAGDLLVSFDSAGAISGLDFTDDDILEYDAGGNSWSLVYRNDSLSDQINIDGLDVRCALDATSPTLRVSRLASGFGRLEWSSGTLAQGHDVVVGSLSNLIATGGDFVSSVSACLLDDGATTTIDHATPDADFWYLVRGVSACGNAQDYGSGGIGEAGTRGGLLGAAASCP